jgi:hypothetical protein
MLLRQPMWKPRFATSARLQPAQLIWPTQCEIGASELRASNGARADIQAETTRFNPGGSDEAAAEPRRVLFNTGIKRFSSPA